MVGGKFEMIKAYLPFSTLTGADTNNPPNPKQIITILIIFIAMRSMRRRKVVTFNDDFEDFSDLDDF